MSARYFDKVKNLIGGLAVKIIIEQRIDYRQSKRVLSAHSSIVIIADFILHCPFRFISRTVKSAEFLNIFFRVEIFSFNELYI